MPATRSETGDAQRCTGAIQGSLVLLAQELKSKGVPVLLLHPGFNKTGMTAKCDPAARVPMLMLR